MKPSHQCFCVRRGFTEKFKSYTNSSSLVADGAQLAECLCPQNACVVATLPCRGTKRPAGPWDVARVRRVPRTEAAVVGLCPDRGSQSPRSAVGGGAGRGRHPVSGRCLGCGEGSPWCRLPRGTCYGGHRADVDAVARRPRRGGGRSRGASLRPGQRGATPSQKGSPRGYGCEEGHQRSGTRTLTSAAWLPPVTRWDPDRGFWNKAPEGEAEQNRQAGGEGSGRSPRGTCTRRQTGLPAPGPAQPRWPSSRAAGRVPQEGGLRLSSARSWSGRCGHRWFPALCLGPGQERIALGNGAMDNQSDGPTLGPAVSPGAGTVSNPGAFLAGTVML